MLEFDLQKFWCVMILKDKILSRQLLVSFLFDVYDARVCVFVKNCYYYAGVLLGGCCTILNFVCECKTLKQV